MKYALLGDIHGNQEALETVLDAIREIGVDKYICMGDIVGYNANPHECLDIIRELSPEAIVKGNHDDYASNNLETIGFNQAAAEAVDWTRRQLSEEERQWLAELPYTCVCRCPGYGMFEIVHGTLDNPSNWGYIFDRYTAETCLAYQKYYLCFVGHTHVPIVFDRYDSMISGGMYDEVHLIANHKYLFNVGSVGQPRDGDPRAAFVIFDTDEQLVRLYRLPYDIEATQRKIRAARLPERLAKRLMIGR